MGEGKSLGLSAHSFVQRPRCGHPASGFQFGCRTPGVDQERWNTSEAKTAAFHTLTRRGYRAQPLRRMHIPKSNGKKRPLGIPTLLDRAMQALYLLGLDPIGETQADPNSYGFRLQRGCADAWCNAIACCWAIVQPLLPPRR